MLITKEVNVKIHHTNSNHFKEKGYIFNKYGDIIVVKINDLNIGSGCIVELSCDYCGKLIKIQYKYYIERIKNIDKCSCANQECMNKKIVDVSLFKYGVSNPSKTQEVILKIKNSFSEKYGVDNIMFLSGISDKIKETFNRKYGVMHPMHLNETKDKIKETSMSKYGYDSYSKTKEYKERIKTTCVYKYGVDNYSKTLECRDKVKNSFLKNYNVDNYTKTKEYKEISKETRINKGNQIPDELLSDFQIYKKKVNNITNSFKKELYKNWDGYDYYDKECIKENLLLKYSDRISPTIDHKVSIFNGFKNRISPEIIGNINNLCITKRYINSSKNKMDEINFMSK